MSERSLTTQRFPASVLTALGGPVLSFLTHAGRLAFMMLTAVRWVVRGRWEMRETIVQFKKIGVESIVLVLVTGLFSGMVVSYQTATQFIKFGGEDFVGGLVGLSLAREAGPMFTAMVAAGRIGAGIAAEVGTMAVTEQIDALRVLATDPIRHLVVPRLLATAVALPMLTMFANLIGGIGGFLVAASAGVSSGSFVSSMRGFLWVYDLLMGLVKTVFFGLIIAAMGSYHGLNATGGADGVGRAATGAVVSAIVLIIPANYFLDLILFPPLQ